MKCPKCKIEMELITTMYLDYKDSTQEIAYPYWKCPRCNKMIDREVEMKDKIKEILENQLLAKIEGKVGKLERLHGEIHKPRIVIETITQTILALHTQELKRVLEGLKYPPQKLHRNSIQYISDFNQRIDEAIKKEVG